VVFVDYKVPRIRWVTATLYANPKWEFSFEVVSSMVSNSTKLYSISLRPKEQECE